MREECIKHGITYRIANILNVVSKPIFILRIQQNIYTTKNEIMKPPSLTPMFKIHKPSKLCPSNHRFVQSEPSTNETNYTNMLLGPPYEKPRNLVTRSLPTCHNQLRKISHTPHQNSHSQIFIGHICCPVPSFANLQIRGIQPLFNQTRTLTCLLDFWPRLYAPKNASSSSDDIINTSSSIM